MKPRETRHKVLIQARMRIGNKWCDVCIRDVSSRGLLVQTAMPPARGTYIEIFKAGHIIVGRVVWSNDRRFGIHTQERMDISTMTGAPKSNSEPPATPAVTAVERRCDTNRLTAAHLANQAERSRRISAVFEFGCVVACGAAGAILTASIVREILIGPLETISQQLQGATNSGFAGTNALYRIGFS